MFSAASASPTPVGARSCSATAEQLRAYLMGLSSQPARARAAMPAVRPALPAGLVDVRQAAPEVVVLPAPQWSEPELRFLVRPEVAGRLHQAAASLPSDLRLGFWEGLRPLPVQQALWDSALSYLSRAHPELAREELESTVEHYVARPDAYPPPHSTGSAVDVAAVDAFGRVLSPADAWGRLGVEILARALRESGLANYEPEWWHWSYGDHEWARVYDCAPLGFAATPEFDGPGGGI